MNTREALEYCRQRGVTITPQGLLQAGRRFGFLVQKELVIDRMVLDSYIETVHESAEENWFSIKKASESLNIPGITLRSWVSQGAIQSRHIGIRKVLHVNIEEIRKFITN